MFLPDNYEKMPDPTLLKKLRKFYKADVETAQYVFDVIRGNIVPEQPLK